MNYKPSTLWGYLLFIALIAAADGLTGLRFGLWVAYLLPIGWAAWNLGKTTGLALAAASSALALVEGLLMGQPFRDSSSFVFGWLGWSATMFAVGRLCALLRYQEVERVHVRNAQGGAQ